MQIHALFVSQLIGLCLADFTIIGQVDNSQSLVLHNKQRFKSIRQSCKILDGKLSSPFYLNKVSLPHNVSSIWTGTYATSTKWMTYQGCSDLSTQRKLIKHIYYFSLNGVEKCQNYCQGTKHFALWESNCICLKDTPNINIPVKRCNSSCSDSGHKCGGQYGTKVYASVYRTVTFSHDNSGPGDKCMSMKCSSSKASNIVLRGEECSDNKQYACDSENGYFSAPTDHSKRSWYESADSCYNINRTLQTYINGNPCNYPFLHNETWIGFFKNITTMDFQDEYFAPTFCSVLDVETWQISNMTDCNEDHYFLCQVNNGNTNVKEMSTSSTNDVSSIQWNTDSNAAINYTEMIPFAKMNITCVNCKGLHKSDYTDLIAGTVTAVVMFVIMLVAFARFLIWKRNVKESKQPESQDLQVVTNDASDFRMMSLHGTADTKHEEYSYAVTETNVKPHCDQHTGNRNSKQSNNDYPEYDHLTTAGSTQYTNPSAVYSTNITYEEDRYDSFSNKNKRFVLDDVYDHTRVTADQDDYDHLHTKNAEQDIDVYSQSVDMI